MAAVLEKEFGEKRTTYRETQEEFLSKTYPLQPGEGYVKYCPVGTNRYRINFYAERKKDEPSFVKDYIINRHYYVVLVKDGVSWKVVESYDK